MSKSKINFEIDAQSLAHAQAFAARHRTSLSKLVQAFFASLGQGTVATPSRTDRILTEVAVGKVSLVDAARELGLQDTGFLLQMMRERNLPLPVLDATLVEAQAHSSLEALQACMLPEPPTSAKKARGKRPVTT